MVSFVIMKDHGNVRVACKPNGYDPKMLWPSGKTNSYPGQKVGRMDFIRDSSGFIGGTTRGATLRSGALEICATWSADSESDGTLNPTQLEPDRKL
jgi:hypothetical protein